MGRWAECLSQTCNFAKARFSEIQSRVSNSLLELIQILYFVQQCESRQPLTEWLQADYNFITVALHASAFVTVFNKNENLYGGKEMLYTKV